MTSVSESATTDGPVEVVAAVTAVVAIPVCNERERLATCLHALDAQVGLESGSLGILLLLNNCTDNSEAVIAAVAPRLACTLRVVVCDHARASAGWARRQAMEAAAAWLAENGSGGGVLLTTDADSRVPPDWVACNLAALAGGADLACGRLALDPEDSALLPDALHRRGILEARYEALLTELAARLDPVPGDSWPRHNCRSGASLAVRLSAYRAVGGMPDIPLGEDRAFVAAVLAHDLVVRHDPDLVVVTSGRLEGRAEGGVADTMRQRCDRPDSPCDDRLERVGRVVARSLLSRHLRRAHQLHRRWSVRALARVLGMDEENAHAAGEAPTFGRLHALFEAKSPRLVYEPLCPDDLPRQIARARVAVALLRGIASIRTRRTGVERSAKAIRRDVTQGSAVAEACD